MQMSRESTMLCYVRQGTTTAYIRYISCNSWIAQAPLFVEAVKLQSIRTGSAFSANSQTALTER